VQQSLSYCINSKTTPLLTKIIAIASQGGAHRITMEELGQYVKKTYGEKSLSSRKFGFLVRENSIAFKNSVIPDFIPLYENPILFTAVNPNPSTKERMQIFDQKAIGLSTDVSNVALQKANLSPKDVTHIISTTCTGLSAPGLELQLTQALGLNHNVVKYGINFMGCYAAFHAIRLADTIMKSAPESKILVVCTELCSLHYRLDDCDDNLLSTYLFSDGCAAAILSNDTSSSSYFNVVDTHSVLIPEGKDDMAWNVGNHGFEMVLHKNIPMYLRQNLASVYQSFLTKNKIDSHQVAKFAIHPGGKNILKAFESAIQIDSLDLAESYEILSNYGNMSSATVLFVLEKMLYDASKDAYVYTAAFGPGLTVEGALLQKV
jgi:predicted naringenin-chalcone synthase